MERESLLSETICYGSTNRCCFFATADVGKMRATRIVMEAIERIMNENRTAKPKSRNHILSVFMQVFIILVVSSVIGTVVNWARHDGLSIYRDWSPAARLISDVGDNLTVSLLNAKKLCENEQALFLDARSREQYLEGHIPCAVNTPWQSFEQYIERLMEISEDSWIVTYCDGEHCSLSEDLARELLAMGYRKVKVLVNGWTRWQEAGFPTEKG